MRVAVPFFLLIVASGGASFVGELEIHYINIGWGRSVFVRGPNGTTLLLEIQNTRSNDRRTVARRSSNVATPVLRSLRGSGYPRFLSQPTTFCTR